MGQGFTFQQDNDPKHTCKVVKAYLERKQQDGTLRLMDWPAQSPDLNVIEPVWDDLDEAKVRAKGKNLDELWKVLKDGWDTMPKHIIKKYANSVKARVAAV